MNDEIIVRGARQHNLKNVNVTIPKNKFVVFTGVSGSGKSSMAFDTIYAEGQRRYVESLSSYARQFLGIMDKPDVDHIDGLSPSISIDQKSVSHNPRSTVGTITEIYDYLRLLFARIGHPFCPNCGREITRLTLDEIVGKIYELVLQKTSKNRLTPTVYQILSPVASQKKGEFSGLFDNLKSKGFAQVIIDGQIRDLTDEIKLDKNIKHTIDVIIDRFSLTNNNLKDKVYMANLKSRLAESTESAINLADGLVKLIIQNSDETHLFSEKLSCPNCNISLPEIEPRMFSFNSPLGACETCKGLGFLLKISPELVLNRHLSLSEGAIIPYGSILHAGTWYGRLLKTAIDDIGIDMHKPLTEISEEKINKLLNGTNKVYAVRGTNRFGRDTVIHEAFIGILGELMRRFEESQSDYGSAEIERYMQEKKCDVCEGKRLKKEILSIRILDNNIYDISSLSIDKLLLFMCSLDKKINDYEKAVSRNIVIEIIKRLEFLESVGLAYLTLSRLSASLSGGEAQRIRLASQIGSGLTGVLYVLDEPSIGLHPRDVAALNASLKKLRDIGNTLIVVEHDTETVMAADHVVDFGLYAGKDGGKVIFSGTLNQLKKDPLSLTGQYLSGRREIKKYQHKQKDNLGSLSIFGCNQYNLKHISVTLPLGKLICVTGVSGSGKSTFVVETLYKALRYYLSGSFKEEIGSFDKLHGYQYLDSVYLVDQSPIGKTPRSNPATYIGLFDHIRDLFAQTPDSKIRGYKKGRFSFNVKGGRCEKCMGAGTIKIEMQFLPDVYVNCDLCVGRRYNSQTLQVFYKGKTIYDVLKMSVTEALDFFKSHPHIYAKLVTLQSVGLSYIELGQPAPTLSGGEAQRIKLAHELSRRETGRTLYVLDEPTTGLHPYDVDKLLQTLYQLVDRGNTVLVIEHNMDVIKNCEYIVDLGAEGGEAGGHLLYQGELNGILKVESSYTGQYLKGKLL